MVEIDGARLLESLRTLRTFGATGTGVVRPTYSDVDMEARRWLVDQMASAGLDARIDGIGNVIGRSPNPGPAVVLGCGSDVMDGLGARVWPLARGPHQATGAESRLRPCARARVST